MGFYDFYRNFCKCTGISIYLGMRDLEGNETHSWPVDVYNINEVLIGFASSKSEYIAVWNADLDNEVIGQLYDVVGPFSFALELNSGQTPPAYVIGDNGDSDPGGIYAIQYDSYYE